MRQILDLHIHSRYSRACSPKLCLKEIEKSCVKKGVDIIATGDFTFPAWFKEIKNNLEEIKEDNGIYKLKKSSSNIKFILSTELALIYKEGEKVRRLHLMVQAPNIKAVEELNKYLGKKYNISSDGRPILGIKAPELVDLCLKIHPQFLIYPAHIWTPWFSVFGSKSGFNRLEECFKEQTENIYAYETGLSSDPEMNWRISELDNLTCLSSSDAHSLNNIGREANIFDLKEISYREIYRIIKERDLNSLLGTIEFYPEEGMYYFDGHRDCNFSCPPEEGLKLNNICPVCKNALVIGVLNRVNYLADREKNFKLKLAPPFYKTIELDKIICKSLNIKSRQSKTVQKEYQFLIKNLGSELSILLDIDLKNLQNSFNPRIIEAIKKVREQDIQIKPGFDGQYGQINIKT